MDTNNNQNSDEKLIEAPAEEPLLSAPEEEKLIPEHTGTPHTSGTVTKIVLGLIGAITLGIIAFAAYVFLFQSSVNENTPVVPNSSITEPESTITPDTQDEGMTACTMDAKICPDGSSVGRTGPNCEFAACPGE